MSPQEKNDMAEVEKAAATLLALMVEVCERQVTPGKEPSHKHTALAACAVTIRDAVKTFVDIAQM